MSATLLVLLIGGVAVVAFNMTNNKAPFATTPSASAPGNSSGVDGAKASQVGGISTATIGNTSVALSADALVELRPGVNSPLDMSFANLGKRPVTVTDLVVSITRVTAPEASKNAICSVNDFVVHQMAPDFTVAIDRLETASLLGLGIPTSNWPMIGMVNSSTNQDGCKGATVLLAYSASGVAD